MAFQVPLRASRSGFVSEPVGTHGNHTIMFADTRRLFAACPPQADFAAYRAAIIDENVLLKRTVVTRAESFRRLRELYALDSGVVLFRALRTLWALDTQAQPLLAVLCAVARDALLRATVDAVLDTAPGAPITHEALAQAAAECFPDRYSPKTLGNIGRNTISSWRQAGHLSGHLHKVRVSAECRPAAVAYALLLGYLCDVRGAALFETLWSRILDAPPHVLYDQAFAASQRGWIEYRHSGNVVEIGFSFLLPTIER